MAEDKVYKILIAHPTIEQAVSMREILKAEHDRSYNIEVSDTANDSLMYIMREEPDLLIIRYDEKNLSTLKIVKVLNNIPVQSRPGVLTFGQQLDIKTMRQLSLLGSLDYIDEPISSITLRIKTKNALGSIEYNRKQDFIKHKRFDNKNKIISNQELDEIKEQRRQIEAFSTIDLPLIKDEEIETEKKHSFKIDIAKVEENTRQFSNINWEINLDQCKSTKGNWVFLADGPAPEMGKWEKQDNTKWNWVWDEKIKEQTNIDLPDYSFEGIEPIWTKGNWEHGKWIMAGKSPSLNLYEKGKEIATNIINFDNNKPEVSNQVESLLPQVILDDLTKTFLLEGEAKVINILKKCHYSNEKIAKLVPYIKNNALQADEENNKLPRGNWIHVGKSPKSSSDLWFFELEDKNYKQDGFYWFEGEEPKTNNIKAEHTFKANKIPNTILKFLVDNNIVMGGTFEIVEQNRIEITESKNAPSELDNIFETENNATNIDVNFEESRKIDLSVGRNIELSNSLSININADKKEKSKNSFTEQLQEIMETSLEEEKTFFNKQELKKQVIKETILETKIEKKSIYEKVINGELVPFIDTAAERKFNIENFEETLSRNITNIKNDEDSKDWNNSFVLDNNNLKRNEYINEDFNCNFFNVSIEKVSIELKKIGGIDLFDSTLINTNINLIKKEEHKKKKIETQRKSEARLNIFTQAIAEVSRKTSNIYTTIVDVINEEKDLQMILSDDKFLLKDLGYDYEKIIELFNDKKSVIYIEGTSSPKNNTYLYPFFSLTNKNILVGLVVFRKGVEKEAFSMTEKITCSAIINSIKHAYKF